MKLSQLPKGKSAKIKAIHFSEGMQQRIAQMGLVIGEVIAVVRPSIAKSPLMVRAQGAYFMIRQQDAAHIHVHIDS